MRRWWFVSIAGLLLIALLSLDPRGAYSGNNEERCDGRGCPKPEKTLYVFAGDQARVQPDFLAVIDFDEEASTTTTARSLRLSPPLPPPGNIGNEPHHCHLSANKEVLACGGLLSLLRGQPGIFFFDVSRPRSPKFLFATSAPQSSITDEFLR